ncbi:tRNA (adenosine(37)-N6)-threonylcarbamoyltransferase complex dimerization subunit type 1 TsaB [Aliamphritea hakodatensis]|uniref:tRNA (adenosine(37)-N6)-threonylcarbamoyltransferase complex dimerization subunit type 1 TsaB n=1 Tax=Aliamphritea hakodatensis TaxID=2895352 RepID=UPI0022FD7071|nr:tRNA (adenosine(37)-N6)-threonylcarbamoyltransferase complex dimerization subunit type 1 TsaB [Aliamphritea hakodatensis]
MANILALDTSTDACSVALSYNGELLEDFRIIPRQHTKQLLPMVEEILTEAGISVAQLDAIAFGRGPGSFAGIRIATGAAQGLAFAAELPVLPVSTLAAIALKTTQTEGVSQVIAALDARMNEIYWRAYQLENDVLVGLGQEVVCPPQALTLPGDGDWCAAGKGWSYLADMQADVQQAITDPQQDIYPTAGCMVQLAAADFTAGKGIAPEDAHPVYLRDEVTWKKIDQQKKKSQQ